MPLTQIYRSNPCLLNSSFQLATWHLHLGAVYLNLLILTVIKILNKYLLVPPNSIIQAKSVGIILKRLLIS